VRKPIVIFTFLSVLLAGYCCQIGRFCTAFKQFADSHQVEKGLTKKVLALRLDYVNSGSLKKSTLCDKKTNSGLFSFFSFIEEPFSITPSFLYSKRDVFVFSVSPESVAARAHGKRGPPFLL
jgi:hypothetical protein